MFSLYTPVQKHFHELLLLFAFLRGVWAISLDWKKRREKPLLHVHFKTVFLPDWFCSQNKHIAAGGCIWKFSLRERNQWFTLRKITSFRQNIKIQDNKWKQYISMLWNCFNVSESWEIPHCFSLASTFFFKCYECFL